jgi:hypothetical protein
LLDEAIVDEAKLLKMLTGGEDEEMETIADLCAELAPFADRPYHKPGNWGVGGGPRIMC